jgi:RNA polymerase sigma factor (sigma-70 family)
MTNARTTRLTHRLCRAILPRDDPGLSDGELLGRYVRTRDDRAFAALVARHGPMVWGVCRRVLRHHHDAEDAFQATFLVLAARGGAVSPRDRVASWLYGVAHNVARKAQVRSTRQRARECPVAELPEPALPDPDVCPDLRPVLDGELSRLPDRYREALLLCDVGGKTHAEAARRLGCPEGTLASRLSRGRALLAARLSRRGVTLPATAAVALSAGGARAVPAGLVSRTLNVAALVAGGAGVAPDRISKLAENNAMSWTKLKAGAAAAAVVATVAIGGGLLLAGRPAPSPSGGRVAGQTVAADGDAENLRRLEGVRWHLLRVDRGKQTLHVADVPAERSWGRDASEQLLASAGSQVSLVGLPVARDARIVLDGKEIPLKELQDGVNLTLKFAADRAVVVGIDATTPPRAGYVVTAVDADKKAITVSRGGEDKPLVLPVADRALIGVGSLTDLKPGTRVRLHLEVKDGRMIVEGLWVPGS